MLLQNARDALVADPVSFRLYRPFRADFLYAHHMACKTDRPAIPGLQTVVQSANLSLAV
jgi:hypothetical protein